MDKLILDIKALGDPAMMSTGREVDYLFAVEDILDKNGYKQLSCDIVDVDDHGEARKKDIWGSADKDKFIILQYSVHPDYGITEVNIPCWGTAKMVVEYMPTKVLYVPD